MQTITTNKWEKEIKTVPIRRDCCNWGTWEWNCHPAWHRRRTQRKWRRGKGETGLRKEGFWILSPEKKKRTPWSPRFPQMIDGILGRGLGRGRGKGRKRATVSFFLPLNLLPVQKWDDVINRIYKGHRFPRGTHPSIFSFSFFLVLISKGHLWNLMICYCPLKC